MIGDSYKYHNSDNVFILESYNHWRYKFACGHWCADSIFRDLINTTDQTGRQLSLNL